MILEAKLAATLIQHAFRVHVQSKKPNELLDVERGFASVSDMTRLRFQALGERSKELSSKWASMHWMQKKSERSVIGGMRGPVHIGPLYMKLIMDIVITLVSESGGNLAHGNRQDLVRHNCITLLACYLANPSSQFAMSGDIG